MFQLVTEKSLVGVDNSKWLLYLCAVSCAFLLLLVFLPTVPGILEPAVSRNWDLKNHVCCDIIILSGNTFSHFKEQLKYKAMVFLIKNLFVMLRIAVQKLSKISIPSLIITNYSSVNSIYLFYLSIYLAILLVVGFSYLACLIVTPRLCRPILFTWKHFWLTGGNRAIIQRKNSLPIVMW